MITLEPVRGNTFCFVTRFMRIPFYRLNDTEIVLMDSGLATERAALEQAFVQNRLFPCAVLTTHAHYDHIGNHNWLQARYGATIYTTLFDAGITQTPLTLQACFYTDRTDVLATTYPYMLLQPDQVLGAQDSSISIRGARFRMLRLPGHAHEHIGFVTPDGVAYLGDLLLSDDEFQKMRLPFHQSWGDVLRSIEVIQNSHYNAYVLAHNAVCTDIRPVAKHNLEQLRSYAAVVASLVGAQTGQAELFARTAKHFRIDLHSMDRVHIYDRIFHSIVTYLEETGLLECTFADTELCYRPTEHAISHRSSSPKGVCTTS